MTDLAPVTCPHCGSDDWTTAPATAVGVLGLGVAAPAYCCALGQAPIWVRCRVCGHEWSAPSRAQRRQQAEADLERRFREFEEHQQRLLQELERRRPRSTAPSEGTAHDPDTAKGPDTHHRDAGDHDG